MHRLGQAALLAEPVVGAAGEVGDRWRGEEVGGDPAVGGLLGDGLGSVLAELETRRSSGSGHAHPGQSKPVRLIDVQHRARRLGGAHLGTQCAHRGEDARHPRSPSFRGGDAQVILADVVTRRPARHRAQPTAARRTVVAGNLGRCRSVYASITLSERRGRADDEQQGDTPRGRRRRAARPAPSLPRCSPARGSPGLARRRRRRQQHADDTSRRLRVARRLPLPRRRHQPDHGRGAGNMDRHRHVPGQRGRRVGADDQRRNGPGSRGTTRSTRRACSTPRSRTPPTRSP